MSEPQPPSGAPRLRSQSGAFDLPSILVGVVVVGILTAGVLAAIFGVIPWAQDRAAKQDLAAINTAQGVTYTKDGQIYKDLSGLEDADLVSGLDQEKTEVTVSDEGQGFEAIVTAGNGNRWMISHKNNVPVELTGPEAPGVPEGEIAWATGHCTPNVAKVVEAELHVYQHPGAFEALRAAAELEVDRGVIDEWRAWTEEIVAGVGGLEFTSEERTVASQLLSIMSSRAGSVEVDGDLTWSQWEERVFGGLRITYKAYCDMYQGMPAYENYPSRAPAEAVGGQSMDIPEGSTAPFIIGFPYSYDPDLFAISSEGADAIPGFKSGVFELIQVDGHPYMTYTMTPDDGGWRSGVGYVDFGVTATSDDPYDVGNFWSSLTVYVE